MKRTKFYKVLALALTLALALAAVGLPGTALATVTKVTISSSKTSIVVGESVTLTASATQTGTDPGILGYVWTKIGSNVSLSDDTGSTTTVTGLKPGTTSLITLAGWDADTSVDDPKTSDIVITVLAMARDSSSAATTNLGGTTGKSQVTLKVKNYLAGSLTWDTSDVKVATVDNGLVKAVGAGTATITATSAPADGDSQSVTFTINVTPVITLTLNPPVGKNVTANLKVLYGGDKIPIATSTIAWSLTGGSAADSIVGDTEFSAGSGTSLVASATFTTAASSMSKSSAKIKATITGDGYTTSKTVNANGSSSSSSSGTGSDSLPKSGQDFRLAYVLGGLCLVMLAATGVLYGVRKKRIGA